MTEDRRGAMGEDDRHIGHGPTLGDVFPALVLTALAAATPLALVLMLVTTLGWWSCVGAGLFSVVLGLLALRLLRRRSAPPATAPGPARFTADQLAALPEPAYREAVAGLLHRDGWTVREIPVGGDVHLVGSHVGGSRIGVRCMPRESSAQRAEDGAALLRPLGAPPAGAPTGALWLLVSPGGWSRTTVAWAARTNVRLLDGALLDRWCAGEHLATVLVLRPEDL
ncbi:hypothetical protein [Kitasatospora griseola]|uniref:hypothetical protein n=1 Tax=Kitasatospora griseola TaxID=2064 RepID=UPI003662A306